MTATFDGDAGNAAWVSESRSAVARPATPLSQGRSHNGGLGTCVRSGHGVEGQTKAPRLLPKKACVSSVTREVILGGSISGRMTAPRRRSEDRRNGLFCFPPPAYVLARYNRRVAASFPVQLIGRERRVIRGQDCCQRATRHSALGTGLPRSKRHAVRADRGPASRAPRKDPRDVCRGGLAPEKEETRRPSAWPPKK